MNNELARLAFVRAQIKATEKAQLERIKESAKGREQPDGPDAKQGRRHRY